MAMSKKVFVGIDSGSVSTKIVFVDEKKQILGFKIVSTGVEIANTAGNALSSLLKKIGAEQKDIERIISTGYGRHIMPFSGGQVTEITCQATGINQINKRVRTIIDIGGQDCKIIKVDSLGKVESFVMNDKCAAGTGRFLEVMAGVLAIDLNESGDLALQSKNVLPISNQCTVFAETEVISLIARGHNKIDILAGLHCAIAKRVVSLARRVKVEEEVALTGGVAKNSGVVKEMEHLLGTKLFIPEEPQITCAFGAAIIACESSSKK